MRTIKKIHENYSLLAPAAEWFALHCDLPASEYLASMMKASLVHGVPNWYVCIENDNIIGGLGVIENDFHEYHEYEPNVCAVYVEKEFRGQGIAGELLKTAYEDMHECGVDTLYLIAEIQGFYERYGWTAEKEIMLDGTPNRIYKHIYQAEQENSRI